MITRYHKLALTATLMLAITIHLSCSSDVEYPQPPPSDNSDVSDVGGSDQSGSSSSGGGSGSGNKVSSSSNGVTIIGYCDYGPITEYGGGCFPMATAADQTNCRAWGQVVSSCGGSGSGISSSSNGASIFCTDFVDGTTREHYGKDKAQFCDPRDGNEYVYVTIGTQIWMAENLNYKASGSKCGYVENIATCDKYGRLYDWATAVNLASSCNSTTCASRITAKHRGICPSGWHLPSGAEWETLKNFAYNGYSAGPKLRATTTSYGGTDDYGFSALPGGYGKPDGYFGYIGVRGFWWSSDESDARRAYYNTDIYGFIEDSIEFDKSLLVSVRCVKD